MFFRIRVLELKSVPAEDIQSSPSTAPWRWKMHGTISDAWAKRVVHRVSHGLQRCCFETWLLTKLKIINHGDRVMYTERIIKQLHLIIQCMEVLYVFVVYCILYTAGINQVQLQINWQFSRKHRNFTLPSLQGCSSWYLHLASPVESMSCVVWNEVLQSAKR